MRNFFLLLLCGSSLLGFSGPIFPNEFPAIVQSVITAKCESVSSFFDLFKFVKRTLIF